MFDITQIAYGQGCVVVSVNSDSLSEVAAPYIRFGDYTEVIESCFTQKELNMISNGEAASLDFNFIVSDYASDKAVEKELLGTMSEKEEEYGHMNTGLFLEMEARKAIATTSKEESTLFSTISKPVELQIDIPLYMIKEGRNYCLVGHSLGDGVIFEDIDEEADTLSININSFGTSIIAYQEAGESLKTESPDLFHIPTRAFFIAGFVFLVGLWFLCDHLHKNSAEE